MKHQTVQVENPRISELVEHDHDVDRDWLTDQMAYELAVACGMAGIPCTSREAGLPEQEKTLGDHASEGEAAKGPLDPQPRPHERFLKMTDEAYDQMFLGGLARVANAICSGMSLPRTWVEDFLLDLGSSGGSDCAVPGVVLLAGPHGSGKTSLARLYAQAVGKEDQLVEIDLAGMTSHYSGSLIDGVEPGFRDSGPGYLTSRVKTQPQSVIVFDNPERAGADVLMRIAQMIRSGKMADRFFGSETDKESGADRQASVVDFQHTTVIFTTSAGAEVYDSPDCLMKAHGDRKVLGSMLLQSLARGDTEQVEGGGGLPATLMRLLQGHVHLMPRHSMAELEEVLLQALKKSMDDYLRVFYNPLSVTIRWCDDVTTLAQALLLTVAHGANMRDVRQDLPGLFMKAVRKGMDDAKRVPSLIRIEVDPVVRTEMDRLSRLVTGSRSLIEELERRQLQLDLLFEPKMIRDGYELLIRLASIKVRQVIAPADVGGSDGIQVQVPAVKFEDVHGQEGARRRLVALARLLSLSGSDSSVCAAMPKGLVLYGAPGTGKTMLAKALAHEGDAPFISTVGSDWRDPQRVRSIMSMARRYAPSVVFIDEIDAIGRRDDGTGSRQAINAMLAEIDGFSSSMHLPVLMVGATNDLSCIDPALLRSGRLDIHVRTHTLEPAHRAALLRQTFRAAGVQDEVPQALIHMTAGCTGADLVRIHRELVCMTALGGDAEMSPSVLQRIVLRVVEGEESDQDMAGSQTHASFHEAGHAIAARLLLPDQPISHVSIIRRQQHGGLVKMVVEGPLANHLTVSRVKATLQVLLAGRMAERIAFGEANVSSGCAADLEAASQLAFQAIDAWGMDETYGLWSAPSAWPQVLSVTSGEVVARAREWVAEADQQIACLLTQNWVQVDALAQRLQSDKWVEGTQVLVSGSYDQ